MRGGKMERGRKDIVFGRRKERAEGEGEDGKGARF